MAAVKKISSIFIIIIYVFVAGQQRNAVVSTTASQQGSLWVLWLLFIVQKHTCKVN